MLLPISSFRHRLATAGVAAAGFAVGVASAGCTGERPTLTSQVGPALAVPSDPSVVAVADRLSQAPAVFTARYTITSTLADGPSADATVSRSGDRLHVRIGTTDYYVTPDVERTCVRSRSACQDGINDAFISNLAVTHLFWGESTRRRLITDDGRKIGPAAALTDTIAEQPSTCVELALAGPTENGAVLYCALDGGGLARYNGADTRIELLEYQTSVDDQTFTVPPVSDTSSATSAPSQTSGFTGRPPESSTAKP